MSETKKMHVQDIALGIASGNRVGYHAYSIMRPFTIVGTLPSAVDGNEILTRFLEVRWNLLIESTALVANGPVYLEMALVKTAQVWGTTSSNVIPPVDIPPNVWVMGGTSNWTRPIGLNKFNGDAVKVIKYKRKSFYPNPNPLTTANVITNRLMYGGKWKIPFKGKKVFAQNPFSQFTSINHGGILRDKQYYLLMKVESTTSAGSAYNILLTYDTSIYFKDF